MRNLKLNATAAGIALVLSGSANAVIPNVVTEIFMSGASAPSNMLRENVVQFDCVQNDSAKPINVFVDSVVTVPGGGNKNLAEPILEHNSFWVVECTANPNMGNAAGDRIAYYKSDVGGSGNGTTPILLDNVTVEFMDANQTNCTSVVTNQKHGNGGTYNLFQCGTANQVQEIPDVGASDVEASKFVGALAPASGPFQKSPTVQEKVGPGLIFGPIVTTSLRDELQTDQIASGVLSVNCTVGDETEACMPSLPSTVVRSITSGKYNNWSDISVYGQTLNVPTTFADSKANNVHLCRRVQGSGTHAEFMIHYQRAVCYDNALPMLTQPGAGSGLFGNGPLVYENSSSGTMSKCMDSLDTGLGLTSSKITPNIAAGVQSFGFGYQSTEKNVSLNQGFRYIKVDMVAPTLANTIKGDYRQVYYSGFQNRLDKQGGSATTGYYLTGPLRPGTPNTPVGLAKAAKIMDLFINSTNISSSVVNVLNKAFLHSWGASGFVMPSATASTVFTTGDPRTPWTREDAAGNADSCQPLYKKL